jgi:protein BUR2
MPAVIDEMADVDSAQDQWLFDEYELAHTPSVTDGITTQDERCRRAKGVNFIIQAGIVLKLPQLTLATAAVFFHRFYMRRSMVAEKGGIHHYVSCPSPPTRLQMLCCPFDA